MNSKAMIQRRVVKLNGYLLRSLHGIEESIILNLIKLYAESVKRKWTVKTRKKNAIVTAMMNVPNKYQLSAKSIVHYVICDLII